MPEVYPSLGKMSLDFNPSIQEQLVVWNNLENVLEEKMFSHIRRHWQNEIMRKNIGKQIRKESFSDDVSHLLPFNSQVLLTPSGSGCSHPVWPHLPQGLPRWDHQLHFLRGFLVDIKDSCQMSFNVFSYRLSLGLLHISVSQTQMLYKLGSWSD